MTYYNKKYFDWQKKAGSYGAQQDLKFYTPFIKESDLVLDFGCGGGYMLEKLVCKDKYGVDINPLARKEAERKGLKVFESLTKIPRAVKFNLIYSHHTLEHLENPAAVIRAFRKLLKKDGKLVCIVPIDDWRTEKEYRTDDVNQHFYTWSPLLLGNLFAHCGYKIQSVEIIERAWVPLSRFYYNYIPRPLYELFSKLWSKITLSRQIRLVAKPV